MVWISVGDSSSVAFNALKKNGIQVYPISAKQYVSSTWVDVTAKSRQGGEWVDWWNGELFDNGNQFEAVTGGWEDKTGVYVSATTKVKATIGNTLRVEGTGSNNCSTITTKNKIDLSDFSAIKFNCVNYKVLSGSGGIGAIHESESCNLLSDNIGSTNLSTAGECTIDVSTIDKECYISIGVNNARMTEVDRIWLVR
jgi:hypothetical protein